MATFNFTPSFAPSLTEKPRVLSARFGDGYEQRVGDGINIRARSWQLTFSSRTAAEIAPIIAFLRARNGIESFDWTDPDAVSGKFTCSEWQKTTTNAITQTLTCTFNEVFEP